MTTEEGSTGRWTDVSTGDGTMRCYLTTPRDAGGAGVLVCMHGPGIDEFIIEICGRLSAGGYAAIAPDFYHRQTGLPAQPWTKMNDTEAVRDMAAAVNALTALSGVDPMRVGAIGFCMGGRLAFLHAANNPALRAAVVFHGGNIMVAKDGGLSPFEQAHDVTAPILGLFGADDENPSPSDVQKIDAELTRLGKAHQFEIYDGAGHAFLNFTRAAAFRETQAKDAWTRCMDWLGRYL